MFYRSNRFRRKIDGAADGHMAPRRYVIEEKHRPLERILIRPLLMDFNQISDGKLERWAGAEVSPVIDVPKNVSFGRRSRGPLPGTHGRPKGYPVSGAAKIQKDRTRERREREQREREASEHDVVIASPAPIPDDWRD
jgi:hypothetical protein